MKKLFYLFALICNSLIATPMQERGIDPAALSQLVAGCGLLIDDDGLVQQTQTHWLRKPGQERWQMDALDPEKAQFVISWAEEQQLFEEWRPSSLAYEKALILGATTGRMQGRLDYLIILWNEGVRFQEIVWLTGERPLDNKVDSFAEEWGNESVAARALWDKADLPEGMRCLPVLFVAVPMKPEGRPNTLDTIEAWLSSSPDECKLLFISDQPFCLYQFSVIKSCLPDFFLFDLAGPGLEEFPQNREFAAAVILDTIARWIYTESLFKIEM